MALLYPNESYKINGAIYEVHKALGPGLLERVYQEALEKELKLQGIPFEREKRFSIVYKGEELEQNYIADFICYNKIIVELKAVEDLLPIHRAQVINYLCISGCKLGLLSKKEVKTLHFQCSLFQILKIFCIFAAWQITETGHIVLVI